MPLSKVVMKNNAEVPPVSKLHAEQADTGHSDEQSLFCVLPHKGDKVNPTHIAGRSLPATTNLPLL